MLTLLVTYTVLFLFSALGGCTGIDGRQFRHGDYYTPQQSACNKCLCKDGQPDRCVQLQCPKPNCNSFERVPGTCCEYKCIKG